MPPPGLFTLDELQYERILRNSFVRSDGQTVPRRPMPISKLGWRIRLAVGVFIGIYDAVELRCTND